MSLTPKEIEQVRALLKPKTFPFHYEYKNHKCDIERALSKEELEDWHARIDRTKGMVKW